MIENKANPSSAQTKQDRIINIIIAILIIILFSVISYLVYSEYTYLQTQIQYYKNQNAELNEVIKQKNEYINNQSIQLYKYRTNSIEQTTSSWESYKNQRETSEIVYVTDTGSKYHRASCSYLKSKNSISKKDAIEQGYTACSRCNP